MQCSVGCRAGQYRAVQGRAVQSSAIQSSVEQGSKGQGSVAQSSAGQGSSGQCRTLQGSACTFKDGQTSESTRMMPITVINVMVRCAVVYSTTYIVQACIARTGTGGRGSQYEWIISIPCGIATAHCYN